MFWFSFNSYLSTDLQIFKDQRIDLNYKVKGKNKVVVYWLARLIDSQKNPTLSKEHTEFRWLPKEEAILLTGFKDFRNMVEYFQDRIPELIKSE